MMACNAQLPEARPTFAMIHHAFLETNHADEASLAKRMEAFLTRSCAVVAGNALDCQSAAVDGTQAGMTCGASSAFGANMMDTSRTQGMLPPSSMASMPARAQGHLPETRNPQRFANAASQPMQVSPPQAMPAVSQPMPPPMFSASDLLKGFAPSAPSVTPPQHSSAGPFGPFGGKVPPIAPFGQGVTKAFASAAATVFGRGNAPSAAANNVYAANDGTNGVHQVAGNFNNGNCASMPGALNSMLPPPPQQRFFG